MSSETVNVLFVIKFKTHTKTDTHPKNSVEAFHFFFTGEQIDHFYQL